MTIHDIKKEFGFSTLSMVRQLDKNGVKQEWLSHWDNDRRIRVSMRQDVFERIKENIAINNLEYRKQLVPSTPDRKEYTRVTIVFVNKPRNSSFRDGHTSDYSYEKYNGAFGYDDDAIDNAFDGDPSNYWNVD